MKSTRTGAKNDAIGFRRSEPIILSDFLPQFYQGRVQGYGVVFCHVYFRATWTWDLTIRPRHQVTFQNCDVRSLSDKTKLIRNEQYPKNRFTYGPGYRNFMKLPRPVVVPSWMVPDAVPPPSRPSFLSLIIIIIISVTLIVIWFWINSALFVSKVKDAVSRTSDSIVKAELTTGVAAAATATDIIWM
ncbi:hypothetical protein AVEN_184981-1 [Araneus ventricosus]|uniref:Uncharacterized protein n=1 Tax=Araneus ventricosus TaxID=182803 RepID=A0A4Y2N702_ARAVE|nr:hypothetical protein AVEN_184981-1 [Araneus ventricosus]